MNPRLTFLLALVAQLTAAPRPNRRPRRYRGAHRPNRKRAIR